MFEVIRFPPGSDDPPDLHALIYSYRHYFGEDQTPWTFDMGGEYLAALEAALIEAHRTEGPLDEKWLRGPELPPGCVA